MNEYLAPRIIFFLSRIKYAPNKLRYYERRPHQRYLVFMRVLYPEMEFGDVGFWGERRTGESGEKPSEQRREPTTNSTHIGRR